MKVNSSSKLSSHNLSAMSLQITTNTLSIAAGTHSFISELSFKNRTFHCPFLTAWHTLFRINETVQGTEPFPHKDHIPAYPVWHAYTTSRITFYCAGIHLTNTYLLAILLAIMYKINLLFGEKVKKIFKKVSRLWEQWELMKTLFMESDGMTQPWRVCCPCRSPQYPALETHKHL